MQRKAKGQTKYKTKKRRTETVRRKEMSAERNGIWVWMEKPEKDR